MANADLRTYHANDVISFRKTAEEYGGLSNMAPGYPLRIADVDLRTSEALYQSCRFPHRPDLQKIIVSEISPMTAKMRSKPYLNDSREHWDDIRVPIMKWCLRVKLAQNWAKFGDLLLRTGNKPIVEDSRKDQFWGAIKDSDGNFRGRNVLGRLLMELREKFKSNPESLTHVFPVGIPDFRLLGRDIPIILAEIVEGASKQNLIQNDRNPQIWSM